MFTITLPVTEAVAASLHSTFLSQWAPETKLSQLGHCPLMPAESFVRQ